MRRFILCVLILMTDLVFCTPDRKKLDENIIFDHNPVTDRKRYGAIAGEENPLVLLESYKKAKDGVWPELEGIFGKDLRSRLKLKIHAADEMLHVQAFLEMDRIEEELKRFEERAKDESKLTSDGKKELASEIMAAKDRLLFLKLFGVYIDSLNATKKTPPPNLPESNPDHMIGWKINAAFETYRKVHADFEKQAEYWKGRKDPFGAAVQWLFVEDEPNLDRKAETEEEKQSLAEDTDHRIEKAARRIEFYTRLLMGLKKENLPRFKKFNASLKDPENIRILKEV